MGTHTSTLLVMMSHHSWILLLSLLCLHSMLSDPEATIVDSLELYNPYKNGVISGWEGINTAPLGEEDNGKETARRSKIGGELVEGWPDGGNGGPRLVVTAPTQE